METSSPLEARFSLTYVERLRAGWALTLSSAASLLWLSFFPLCGIVLIWLMVRPSSRNSIWDAILVALCFGFVPFMFLVNTYRAHRADQKNGPYTYSFDHAGLQVHSLKAELKQNWGAILRARERLGIVFLYFNKQCAHCIPVRAFANPDCANSVLRLASENGVPRVEK